MCVCAVQGRPNHFLLYVHLRTCTYVWTANPILTIDSYTVGQKLEQNCHSNIFAIRSLSFFKSRTRGGIFAIHSTSIYHNDIIQYYGTTVCFYCPFCVLPFSPFQTFSLFFTIYRHIPNIQQYVLKTGSPFLLLLFLLRLRLAMQLGWFLPSYGQIDSRIGTYYCTEGIIWLRVRLWG